VLPYKEARDGDDERHVHPLQLDVIERACVLWSNPGEVVLTPFMGVGSEVAGALMNGRRGVGIELKNTYYRQAVRNLESIVEREGEVAASVRHADGSLFLQSDLFESATAD
jgi:DNA modification methylase